MNSVEHNKCNKMGRIRNSRNTFLILVILIMLLFISYNTSRNLKHSYKLLQLNGKKSVKSDAKIILLWNPFFRPDWYFGSDTLTETYFIQQNCPVTNCVITNNKIYLESVDQFDAVLIHVAQAFSFLESMPKLRRPEQLYVFFNHESPAFTQRDLSYESNIYNLTATYRLDSDLLWPYGFIEEIESGVLVAPAERPFWKSPSSNFHLNKTQMDILKKKTKLAAWFVSHCNTPSKRDDLVKSLQKYMKVDIYGKCGTLKCSANSNECKKKLDNDYKFYFSFENSLYTDYVTEKFFQNLERFIIPVVFGGADYNRFAPPNSYINAQDFKTSKELANYLLYLSKNDEEYQKYFWWKEHYRVIYRRPFCELCSKLNNPAEREKTQYYRNIKKWWNGQSSNLNSRIAFN